MSQPATRVPVTAPARSPHRAVAALLTALLIGACASVPQGVPAPSGDEPAGAVLTLPSGRSLPVDPDQLTYTGTARIAWPDGRVYDGQLADGLPDGVGVETLPDGTRYQGQWQAGKRHGFGSLSAADGSAYEGEWQNGLRFGSGTYLGADGDRYDGEWAYDQPSGFGTRLAADGETYTGEWAGGRRYGYGRLETAAGLVYEGTWVDGERHGYGTEHRPDGSRYEGEWQRDKRHGQGRETRPDGAYHDGLWELNQPLGPGLRHAISGIDISGMWTRDTVTTGLVKLPTGPEYAGPLFGDAGRSASPRLLDWLVGMAERGDPYAQLLLGTLRLELDRPAADPEAARAWLGRAAEAGVAEAQYRLAQVLLGEQPPRVVALLAAAADQNHAEANRQLGDFYASGYTVPRSPERAIGYYQRAVDAGSVAARNDLAWLLATTSEETLRDGERALALIRPIALYTGAWRHLDTLAAAWAAAGEFETAAAVAEVALQAHDLSDAGDGSQRAAMAARLAGYQNQRPHVEPEPS
ncbi:MAG: hypothetical protein RIB46_17905 [Pseudomonadales bacterium]